MHIVRIDVTRRGKCPFSLRTHTSLCSWYARSEKPSMESNRREDLAPVFDELNKYEATTHFMGQSTVVLDGVRATGETYCIAHHVSASEGKRNLFIASLCYFDVFAKVEGKWLFAERKIMVDWTDTRPINVCNVKTKGNENMHRMREEMKVRDQMLRTRNIKNRFEFYQSDLGLIDKVGSRVTEWRTGQRIGVALLFANNLVENDRKYD